jgi:hypothetical protein
MDVRREFRGWRIGNYVHRHPLPGCPYDPFLGIGRFAILPSDPEDGETAIPRDTEVTFISSKRTTHASNPNR